MRFWFILLTPNFRCFRLEVICFYPSNLQLKYKLQYLDPREMELTQNIKQTISSELGHDLQVPSLRARCSCPKLPEVLISKGLKIQSTSRNFRGIWEKITSPNITPFPKQTYIKLLIYLEVEGPDPAFLNGNSSEELWQL